ncbi:MAG: hypothetical protein ABI542_02285 [Gemmatimonadota bacterium]
MDEAERNQRMESAVRDAVANQADQDRTEHERAMVPLKRRQRRLWALLLLSWVAIIWIWSTKPAFIFGVEGGGASPVRREASLRFGMVLEQSRAREYHDQTGQWPSSLVELGGEGENGVTGAPAGSGFLIKGSSGDLQLELTDRMAADSFLGRSLQILRTDP